ncbi:protein translocase subunit SecD [Aestuariibacter sp. A3R04]|uniref:protein translocase subunit SecD n=1 Tax=Aestuariibacter sp. A3R04 TaxID=2841571 RepID=UPI001C08712D|nr:protein translocase subunit SecD [Aestuariibacter sp. A3R04]MBU3021521.1 protein translocase subunit SecD [Aestuariibacter sp. A3R04]
MKFFSLRGVIYALVIVLGLLSAVPNVLPTSLQQRLPQWYTQNQLALGLDLQGGSHLLLSADTQPLLDKTFNDMKESLLSDLRKAGIHYQVKSAKQHTLVLSFHGASAQRQQMWDVISAYRYDTNGQPQYTVAENGEGYTVSLTEAYETRLVADALDRSVEVVRRRLDETGLVEPSVSRQGNDGVLVQMPGVTDPSRIRELLGTTAQMQFHWVAEAGEKVATVTIPDSNNTRQYRLEKRVAMEGEHIKDAQLAFDPNTGNPVVNFKLDSVGGRIFADMTRSHIGETLAVVLDNKVITAPVIRSVIGASGGEISGQFTASEARDLALMLRAGALPVPLTVIEERTVGPDLGSDAIKMGLITGLIGAALVLAFMVTLYRRWGLIACLSLSINMGLVFGILSLFGATLTLPGIAGIILTLGMAVDANILINERIKEESRKGRGAGAAISAGFNKAWATILDSSLTTLIAVSLLFLFGSGPVKGFAITIGIGLFTSMFTAIAVTKMLMQWLTRKREREALQFPGVAWINELGRKRVNFLRGRMIGLTVSAVLSVASVFLFFTPGLHYGVDFTGGTLVEVNASDVSLDNLRTALANEGVTDASIQAFGENGDYLIRVPSVELSDPTEQAAAQSQQVALVKGAVTSLDDNASFPRVDMVGAKVSDGFADASILAILIAGGGILLYLWVRFESHFALAATATIALDLTKTIGFFAVTGLEFNLTAVAALLALIGYSINDKVVVFDRIREGFRMSPDKPIEDVLNSSISATLTRTLFTSVTTMLALLPMGLAGGASVASFALPMLFGIIIGTSSSIFIASPILFYLGKRREKNGLKQIRPTAEEVRMSLAHIP